MTQLGLLNDDATAPAERGRIHVHFGDWREQEPDWPRPFVFVSDVPYGQAFDSGWNRGTRKTGSSIKGDMDTLERDSALGVDGWVAAAIWGPGGVKAWNIPPWGDPVAVEIWDKAVPGMGNLASPFGEGWETVAIYGAGWRGRRSSGVHRHVPGFRGAQHHPHEKPLPLVCEYVSKAPPGLPIVDPFLGSGTTAVACALLGREFYGAEVDPQYWPVIRGRLAAVGVAI